MSRKIHTPPVLTHAGWVLSKAFFWRRLEFLGSKMMPGQWWKIPILRHQFQSEASLFFYIVLGIIRCLLWQIQSHTWISAWSWKGSFAILKVSQWTHTASLKTWDGILCMGGRTWLWAFGTTRKFRFPEETAIFCPVRKLMLRNLSSSVIKIHRIHCRFIEE